MRPLRYFTLCAAWLLTGLPVVAQKKAPPREVNPTRVQKSLEVLMAWPSDREVDDARIHLTCSGKVAIPGLILMLNDPRLKVRTVIYRVLEELGDDAKPSVPMLEKRFRSKDRWERVRAAQLALTFDPNCGQAMFVLAATNNVEYRCRAARWLKSNPDEAAVTVLSGLFDDYHKQVRRIAYVSIGSMGQRAAPAVPKLIRKLTGKYASPLDVEDIPGAVFSGGDNLGGADRALFELESLSVPQLLKQHVKAKPAVQFRVLNLLGAMQRRKAQRKAIRISLLADDAKLREIAFKCLANLKVRDAAEFSVLLESVVRFGGDAATSRVREYLKWGRDEPVEQLDHAFRGATREQRVVILSVLNDVAIRETDIASKHYAMLLLRGARDKAKVVRLATYRVVLSKLNNEKITPVVIRDLVSVCVALAGGGVDASQILKRAELLQESIYQEQWAAAKALVRALSRKR